MARLLAVSNRVNMPKPSNQPSAGGLAVALSDVLKRYDGVWFGWSGEVSETGSAKPEVLTKAGVSYALIDLPEADFDAYYNGYANRTLWPLFHYRIDLMVYTRQYWQGYTRINHRFAQLLAPLLKADDLIWVHDYHLINCAEQLRRMGHDNRMGFFLHIPFPTPQVLLTLPNHEALVRALFAHDLIGFQAESDRQALEDYVVHCAGGRREDDGRLTAFGRTVTVKPFPIGIDADGFARLATGVTGENYRSRMEASLKKRDLIIGVDRLDYSKGLLQRMEAFERLLETYPENRNRVSFLQIAPPTREDVPEYGEIRGQLESATGRINGRFAEFDWVPIRYLNRGMGRSALAGLFRASRIGLVTPYRDGMNLVAKEYVAAQNPKDPGVLVLSQFAGAADQLRDAALLVNPYDLDDIADAVQRGLNLALKERRERWRALYMTTRKYSITWWRDAFVAALRGDG